MDGGTKKSITLTPAQHAHVLLLAEHGYVCDSSSDRQLWPCRPLVPIYSEDHGGYVLGCSRHGFQQIPDELGDIDW